MCRSAFVVAAATGAQMVTPGFVQRCLGSAAASGLGACAVRCASFLQQERISNPLGMTVAHGIATKTCADLLAQTIPQQVRPLRGPCAVRSEALTTTRPARIAPRQDAAVVWVDQLRLFRSMLASLLSTSLPFYWWTRAMHPGFKAFASWLRTTGLPTGLLNGLTTGLGAATLKTIITQALFRPINVLLFLGLQSVFRGVRRCATARTSADAQARKAGPPLRTLGACGESTLARGARRRRTRRASS